MDNLILSPIKLEDLLTQLRTVVKEELATTQTEALGEKFMSPAQTCELFQPKISKVTLSAWTRNGKLTEHRIGGRVYYKYSEIIEAVTRLKKYKRTL